MKSGWQKLKERREKEERARRGRQLVTQFFSKKEGGGQDPPTATESHFGEGGTKSLLFDHCGDTTEPDVIQMYSSSPPPLEDGADEDDDEFSDFTSVPNSVSFTEFETLTTFDQLQALNATSPPELTCRVVGLNGPAMPNRSPGDAPAYRTVSVEDLKKVTEHPHGAYTNFPANTWTGNDAVDCNRGGNEVLTNGFAKFGTEGTPPSHHKRRETGPLVGLGPDAIPSDDEDFADFAAFSNAEVSSHIDSHVNWENSNNDARLAQDSQPLSEENHGASITGKAVDDDDHITEFASFAEASDHLSNGDGGFHAGTSNGQTDQGTDHAHPDSNTTDSVSTEQQISQNGVAQDGLEVKETMDNRVSPVSIDDRGSSSEPTEEKGSENDTETETETETSFGRPLSTEALEEFGDFSTTGSVPSPPLQEETATPADHSQLAEDDDEEEDFGDFGDFGDANSFGGAGFADFDQQGAVLHCVSSESITPSQSVGKNNPEITCTEKVEFGDFDAHGQSGKTAQEGEEETETVELPGSDSFADFTSAPVDGGVDVGWQAFGESNEEAGESWAAFDQNQASTISEKKEDDWHGSGAGTAPPTGSEECRKDSIVVSLVSRLEKVFLANFHEVSMPLIDEDMPPLKSFLEPCEGSEKEENESAPVSGGGVQGVWLQLQDIHNAFGLRYQWGGSHSNKTLLCSLGIDTRNILFTGQKKQPVIVPMYAASLGMLEPTKEPVKPVSAAEMIASIAQSPSVATEMSSCPTDAAQESLPPVQFDWSSSGLTNPLDASGGSSLLNLDFFGPVDESPSSSTTSIPGVDPELYELTQAKLDMSGGSSRVVDAFARLMSTVEKTNTSTRRLQTQKEENLSEEARRVISVLPDLSFMQAKVLMFPSTLTPLPPSSCSSSSPVPD